MAHFSREFTRSVLSPLLASILGVYCVVCALSLLAGWQFVLVLIPTYAALLVAARRLAIYRYLSAHIDPGTYDYAPELTPCAWHRKMGYLRLLEIMTPRDYWVRMYRACGARIAASAVCAGRLTEPDLTSIEEGVVIGQDALVTAHEIVLAGEKQILRLTPVHIGKNCIVGARSVVLPGVELPANTIVPAGTVVRQSGFTLKAPSSSTLRAQQGDSGDATRFPPARAT